MQSRLIRSREVQAITGLPKSSLHNMARIGRFPRPLKLGARAVAWREEDVQAWIENLEAKEVR
jgi:prophage regulatory protein